MDISIYPDTQSLGQEVAGTIAALLRRKPDAVLALASGRTPEPVYEALVALHAQGKAPFDKARVFALDEYMGVGPDHPDSFAAYFRKQLFTRVDLSPFNCWVPDGASADPVRECRAYEARILAAGGIDLCLLGIGTNGHLAFNEPGPILSAQAHVAEISDDTRRKMPRSLDAIRYGLTMGMASLMNAREILLIATGEAKAEIVTRSLLPLIDTMVPASLLQLHPNARFAMDGQAARNFIGSPEADRYRIQSA